MLMAKLKWRHDMQKETLSLLGGMIAFGAALLMVARPAPADTNPYQAINSPARTIQTSGSAVIRVQPDKVTIRLGVETFGVTPRESQASNARLIEAVIKAVRSKEVPAQDIATDFFAVYPQHEYSNSVRKVVGYWAHNTIVVTVRQVNKLSAVLTSALEAGATNVDDVTFSTSRLRELRDQARAMAVKAALEKAHGMATAAGATLGDTQHIADQSQWQYYGWYWNSRMSTAANLANFSQNVVQTAPGGQEAPPPEDGEFSLGQIAVQAQVKLTASMK
jgi:uncharacterized protein YggE